MFGKSTLIFFLQPKHDSDSIHEQTQGVNFLGDDYLQKKEEIVGFVSNLGKTGCSSGTLKKHLIMTNRGKKLLLIYT